MFICDICGSTVNHVNDDQICFACLKWMKTKGRQTAQVVKKDIEDKDNQEFMLAYFNITLNQFELVNHDNLSEIVDSEFAAHYKDAQRVLWHDYRANAFTKKGTMKKAVEKKITANLITLQETIKEEDMDNSNKEIVTTDFDYNYHNSEKHSSSNMSEYVRHNVDVYNQVMGLDAVYQSAQSYYHGDYSTPSAEVELSVDGGADKRLVKLNELYEEDFTSGKCDEYLKELADEIGLSSISELHNLYLELMDNNSRAQQYAQDLDVSEVFIDDDY